MATIKDIAKYSGVSTTTVSRIINNKADNISQEVKDRVMLNVKKYNYTPYGLPAKDLGSKSFTICLVSRSVQSSSLIVNGLLEYIGEQGYSLMIFDSKGSIEIERENLSRINTKSIDGVIWEPVSKESIKHIGLLSRFNGRMFCINSGVGEIKTYSQDFEKMGYICTKALIEKGHKDIACIVDPTSRRSDEVAAGYKKCLFDYDLISNQNLLLNYDEQCLSKVIEKGVTGIVCSHFSMAQNLYTEFVSLNRDIPGDLSIVSLRNRTKEKTDINHISTIDIPDYDFGIYVGKIMVDLCEQKNIDNRPFEHELSIESDVSVDVPDILRSKKIMVVGTANIDTFMYVDKIPKAGDSAYTTSFFSSPGGKGLNTAIAVSKQNKNVYLISEIGKDNEGSLILQKLKKNNVNTSLVSSNPKYQTRKTFLTIDKNGESSAVINTEARSIIKAKDIENMTKRFDGVGVCIAQAGLTIPVALKAFEIAKSKGAITIFKPFPVYDMSHEDCKNIDIIVPDRKEACELSKTNDLNEAVDYLLDLGIKTVILTLDKDGVLYATKENRKVYPAPRTNAVDTTGASDAFIATLAVKLLEGCSMDDSIQAALVSVGFFVSGFGILDSFINKETLDRLLKTNVS